MASEIPLPQVAIDAWPGKEAFNRMWAMYNRLYLIGRRFFGTSDPGEFLSNQAVVSLGCGSLASTEAERTHNRMNEAWMPRLCHAYGANPVIGIDIYPGDPADREIYEHRQANLVPLLREGRLVDLLSDVQGAVKLMEMSDLLGGLASPTLLGRIAYMDLPELSPGLLVQAKGLLKENGVLLIENAGYILSDGNLLKQVLW